jgi:hypothetical protein
LRYPGENTMSGETENNIKENYNTCRHFVAYSGVKLPLKLVNPLEESDMRNRNTFFRGYYNDQDQLMVCQKVVYGEIEFEHNYEYYDNGNLKTAIIKEADEEAKTLSFDEQGNMSVS